MFKLFKKDKPLNYTQRLLQLTMEYYDKCGTFSTRLVTNSDWQSVKFLNKRGLIKYFKAIDPYDAVRIEPTLLCLYLTKVMKYDIQETYNEAVKLYNKIGEVKNGANSRKVLLQGTTSNKADIE